MMIRHVLAGLGLLGSLCIAGAAAAEGERPPPREPPPEAFTACSGKAENAECSVTIHDQTIDGTCHALPDKRIACRPNHPPPHHGPPPEAVKACSGKAAGAACTAPTPDGDKAGVCEAGPDETVACRPNDMPAPPPEE